MKTHFVNSSTLIKDEKRQRHNINILTIFFFSFCFLPCIKAQQTGFQQSLSPASRILKAPETEFNMFIDAGLDATNHELTKSERNKVEQAFLILPQLHQRILQKHLHSISFMDNMPNTALTSPVSVSKDSIQLFNITFRAGILGETVSEWVSWKENSCFIRSEAPELQ